jgi:hypothetical protein
MPDGGLDGYRFALPFNLMLPSDKYYYFFQTGQLVAVRTSTKHGVNLFSYERDYTDWIAQEKIEIRHHESNDPSRTLVLAFKLVETVQDFKGGLVNEVDYSILDLGRVDNIWEGYEVGAKATAP